jgi:hypothetical protein
MAHHGLVEGRIILIIIEVIKIIHGVILIQLGPMVVLKWSHLSKMLLHSVESAHSLPILVSSLLMTPMLCDRKVGFAFRHTVFLLV